MSLFRSRKIDFYNLVIPRESAWEVMNALGNFNCVHFIDQDPTLPQINRPFSNYIKRCDDILQKVQLINQEMKTFQIEIQYCPDIIELLEKRNPSHKLLDEVEIEVQKASDELIRQQLRLSELQEQKNKLRENLEVLKKAQFFQSEDGEDAQLLGFQKTIGIISKEDELRFKRIMFRVTKGNVHVEMLDIEEQFLQQDKKQIQKCVFMLFYPDGSSYQQKVKRILESFQCNKYDVPSNQEQHDEKLTKIQEQLQIADQLLQLNIVDLNDKLTTFSKRQINCSWIEEMRILTEKEKYLYANLNLLNMTNSVFHGSIWLPQDKEQEIQDALRNIHRADSQLPNGQIQQRQTNKTPPTYFKLNPFTYPFQEIVNTYGIPRYQEINPGLSTIITFPFLVGVMFGDIGHGLLLFVFGLYLTTEDAKKSSFSSLTSMRYVILLIGFFACYNGLIYNDFLSMGLNLFGSCYTLNDGEYQLKDDCVYSFGIDPAWGASQNQLTFMNSYKMKQAVIIGVIHMIFGIILKGFNTMHFKNYVDFWEFVPQLLLMICSFGYMDLLLILKWITPYEDKSQAPSVITTMIDMVLNPFGLPEKPLFESAELQRQIQLILLLIISICVPTMLFIKPIIMSKKVESKNQNLQQQPYDQVPSEDDANSDQIHTELNNVRQQSHEPMSHINDEHDFGELFVHQTIETIEFVLGSVSNTASYLRLWALSLAHGQLAEVFFSMTIADHLGQGGFFGTIGSIIQFPGFALATFGVLMCMDLMECFLHALRLQWVEFQSKFYKADGYLFNPYSFSSIKSQPEDN